ncbi:MAG: hypothetical protein V4530_16700 [Pseudomonadota bacterium]
MFDSTYRSAMRNGSRILFAIAVLMFVVGLLQTVRLIGTTDIQPFGQNNALQWGWVELVGVILNAVSFGVAPLIGALVIDRADRWFARNDNISD